EGLSHLDAAVEGAMTMGRFSRLPLLLVKCGQIHLLADEPDEAMRLAIEALRLATIQHEHGNEVYARHFLGDLHSREDSQVAEARRCYGDALKLAVELGMRPMAAHCHAGLSRLYARTGDDRQAREHRTAAATAYREMDMRFWLVQFEAETAAVS